MKLLINIIISEEDMASPFVKKMTKRLALTKRFTKDPIITYSTNEAFQEHIEGYDWVLHIIIVTDDLLWDFDYNNGYIRSVAGSLRSSITTLFPKPLDKEVYNGSYDPLFAVTGLLSTPKRTNLAAWENKDEAWIEISTNLRGIIHDNRETYYKLKKQ